jgi:hypothetical protein
MKTTVFLLSVVCLLSILISCEKEDISISDETASTSNRIPKVPFFLDGQQGTPENFNKYKYQPLYYAVIDNEPLQIFTNAEQEIAYSKEKLKGRTATHARTAGPEGVVALFEHADFDGWCWQYNAYRSQDWWVPDFRNAPWFGNINNKVSSVVCVHTESTFGVILYKDLNFQGSSLRVVNTGAIDLRDYSLDDCISSMRATYHTF